MVDGKVMRRKRVWTRKPEFTEIRVHAPTHVSARWARYVPIGRQNMGLVQTVMHGEMECVERILKQKRGRGKILMR